MEETRRRRSKKVLLANKVVRNSKEPLLFKSSWLVCAIVLVSFSSLVLESTTKLFALSKNQYSFNGVVEAASTATAADVAGSSSSSSSSISEAEADGGQDTRTSIKKSLPVPIPVPEIVPVGVLGMNLTTRGGLENLGNIAQGLLQQQQQQQQQQQKPPLEVEDFMPKQGTLFQKDAIDSIALDRMDCHLRNLDYCLAGVIGTAGKMLPETDAELEARCDEMKATTTCISVYNDRCQTMKIFSSIAPMVESFTSGSGENLLLANSGIFNNDNYNISSSSLQIESILLNQEEGSKKPKVKIMDFMKTCDPKVKGTIQAKATREKLFAMAKCINTKIPLLSPCIDDIKVAFQLFYEPRRMLPMKPTCCAISRFRKCSTDAMDNICGFSSFEQLEMSLQTSGGGGGSMLRSIERVCGKSGANFETPYCREILPPSGLKLTQQRRGQKASKLAKVLDLIQFAPKDQSAPILF